MKHYHVIIGLGNPDPLLLNTYHNVGIMALEALGKGLHFKAYKGLFEYAEAGTAPDGTTLALVKPLVFMNESGVAARAAAKMFNTSPAQITVMHDDSDLALGDVKFSKGQSSAGHRGVQSIIDALGSKDFARVRIGIRNRKETRRKKAGEFVLKPIKASDKKTLASVFEAIAEKLSPENPTA